MDNGERVSAEPWETRNTVPGGRPKSSKRKRVGAASQKKRKIAKAMGDLSDSDDETPVRAKKTKGLANPRKRAKNVVRSPSEVESSGEEFPLGTLNEMTPSNIELPEQAQKASVRSHGQARRSFYSPHPNVKARRNSSVLLHSTP